jgi:hypothetical protein
MGNNLMGAANARASSYLATGNALNSAGNKIASSFGGMYGGQ